MAGLNFDKFDWTSFVSADPTLVSPFSYGLVNVNNLHKLLEFKDKELIRVVAISFGQEADKTNKMAYYLSKANLTTVTIKVKSIQDLVNQLKVKCGNQRLVIQLDIVGHGYSKGQNIGDDFIAAPMVKFYNKELTEIEKCLHKDAIIVLGGCNVGYAQQLLSKLSNVFKGRKVMAGSAYQRPAVPGLEGGITTCKNDECSFAGKTGWDYVDKLQDKFYEKADEWFD